MHGGFAVFDSDRQVTAWARAAEQQARDIAADPAVKAANLRHGETWFVGVDALPNGPDGSIAGVPLTGPWHDHITAPASWHPAQLSIVYPGYPKQDVGESHSGAAAEPVKRCTVDGLARQSPHHGRGISRPDWQSGSVHGGPDRRVSSGPPPCF